MKESLENINIISHLSGFSGATVLLIEKKNRMRAIRKIATTKKSRLALKQQVERQMYLKTNLGSAVNIPDVIGCHESADEYWYDMQYIQAIEAVDFLSAPSRLELQDFTSKLFVIYSAQSIFNDQKTIKFDLVDEVNKKLTLINGATDHRFSYILSQISHSLPQVKYTLYSNIVHGDMTLENILVDKNSQLWLIDPAQSSGINHYWLDVAKTYQGLHSTWFAHRNKSISRSTATILSDIISRHMNNFDPDYSLFHKSLTALNYARILPYCLRQSDTQIPLGAIERILYN